MLISAISQMLNAQIPSYIPKDSLVGWWPFNGNANDESGNGHNGTVYNASLSKDRNGITNSSYEFNGSSSYIEIASNKKLFPKNYSISIWFKATRDISIGNNSTLLRSGDNKNCNGKGYAIASFEFKSVYGFSDFGSGGFSFKTSKKISSFDTNTWYNLVFVRTNGNCKQYLNGNIIDVQYSNSYEPAELCNLFIGSNSLDNNNKPWDVFKGLVDDFGIWNRALDSNEVKGLYLGCSSTVLIEPSDCGKFNGNASFKFHVSDTTSKFQWQINQGTGWTNLNNAGQFSGTTLDSLIVKNITLSNDGQLFRCISTSNCGKNTSREAKLSVWGVNTNSIIKQAFTLSPNPVKDILNIQGVQTNANYQITNAIGQTCLQGKLTEKLDVSALKSGVYFFKTETGTQRFVKE